MPMPLNYCALSRTQTNAYPPPSQMYIEEHQDKYCPKHPDIEARKKIEEIRAKMSYSQPWLENAKIMEIKPGEDVIEEEPEDGDSESDPEE